MKIFSTPRWLGFIAGLATTTAAWAQTSDGSMLFSANGNLSTGTQNSYVGTVGGIFLSTYSYYPKVNWLGYYDQNGDGLANSHEVGLWDNNSQSLLASVTVPAGTAAPLINGYRWVQLATPVDLWYGTYYIIGAKTDGVDLWGDFITNDGGAGQIAWNPEYAQLGSGWEFSRAGRYDDAANWPSPPPNQSGTDAIYPVANLGYNLSVVPEPTSLSLLGLGALFCWKNQQKRKS